MAAIDVLVRGGSPAGVDNRAVMKSSYAAYDREPAELAGGA
jgi:hypothetical protein